MRPGRRWWNKAGAATRGALSALILFVLAAGPAAAADLPTALDLRLGAHPGYTRFVVELDSPLVFQVYTLADPYRVVVDLPEVDWRLPSGTASRPVGDVAGFRFGLFKPGQSRVVLDAKRPLALHRSRMLPPGKGLGYRFVLDLRPTSRPVFLATAGLGHKKVVTPKLVIAEPSGEPPVEVSAPRRKPPAAKPRPARSLGPVAARLATLAPPGRKPTERLRRRVVVLDPGHGGIDPGAIGISGIYEKHITLSMAREVRDRLNKTGRYKVLLTRDRDVFVRLRDRVAFGRDNGGEVFLSLHADTIRNKSIRGLSVYTLSEKASDKEAALLAEKENKADLIAGVDLTHESEEVTNILIDLAQRETMNQSVQLAGVLVRSLAQKTKLLRNSHRFAGFAVLKAPDVPSVLVELGFLSNRRDERELRDAAYRAKLADAITAGIEAYFAQVEEARTP